jgi:hypothetical protein
MLSHTWGDEEVLFQEIGNGTGENKTGYKNIRFWAEQAKRDGLQYIWVDTYCIDKSNKNELSTVINSMFLWDQNAERCYVYLSDISPTSSEQAFRRHRWFTRGWILQELLVLKSVEFFTQDGQRLGDRMSLELQIYEIIGIAVLVLRASDFFLIRCRGAIRMGGDTPNHLGGRLGVCQKLFLLYDIIDNHIMSKYPICNRTQVFIYSVTILKWAGARSDHCPPGLLVFAPNTKSRLCVYRDS